MLNCAKTLAAGMLATLLVSAPAQAAETLKLALDWFVNPDHATLVVAKEKGYFENVGLDVELVAPADPNDPPKLVAAGKFDVAVSYQPQLHLQVAEGLPLRRIATLVATPLNTLVVLDSGPIKTLKDLKGKKVGFSVGGFEDAILGIMLEGVGLSLKDIELINVNFSLSPSIISGQVAGVIGAFRNFELNQMDIVNKPGRAFYPEEHGVPAYDELILIANSGKLSDPRLPKFLDALEQATIYLMNHPKESWELFIKAYPNLDDELNKRAWADTLRRFAKRPRALDTTRYDRFAKFLTERGLMKTAGPASDYAVVIGAK
ncbi:MAG: ABC transporter substrate-binding protein [Rhizobiales bacterium]|nr:ABC transporter substrate-binding protein [Hyphomicrobiales bacterium]